LFISLDSNEQFRYDVDNYLKKANAEL